MGSVAALLSEAKRAGLQVVVEGDRLKIKGPRRLELVAKEILERKGQVLEHLKTKRETIGFFQPVSQIGQCEHCRAAGYWDEAGPGLWCFYEAAFLCKSGKAVLAKERREVCPLRRESREVSISG